MGHLACQGVLNKRARGSRSTCTCVVCILSKLIPILHQFGLSLDSGDVEVIISAQKIITITNRK